LFIDGAGETACYGGRGDSALGDSVLSTDDMSDPTSRHRGYSADDDDDDDDVIPDAVRDFQVADVTRYVHSLPAQPQRKSGIVLQRQYTVSQKKLSRFVFVRTSSNFHQFR